MKFDTLCDITETNEDLKIIEETLHQTKIFQFDYEPFVDKGFDKNDIEFLKENFFLPFPTVAIEDNFSCVILQDTSEKQIGLGGKRSFVIFIRPEKFLYKNISHREWTMRKEMRIVIIGILNRVKFLEEKEKFLFEISPCHFFSMIGKETYQHQSDFRFLNKEHPVVRDASSHLNIAFKQILYINHPKRFVVEETPIDLPKVLHGKIARSYQRPKYTILEPKEIRKKLGLIEPEGTHASPVPHERRSHIRTFRNAKFVNALGKTIVIPATWIGEKEAIVGNKKYIVRTEL